MFLNGPAKNALHDPATSTLYCPGEIEVSVRFDHRYLHVDNTERISLTVAQGWPAERRRVVGHE